MSTLVPARVPGPKLATGVVRCALLVMVAALATVDSPPSIALWLLALACVGVTMAVVPAEGRRAAAFAPVVESVVVAVGVVATGGASSPLLPYLLVPALAAGVHGGLRLLAAVLAAAEAIFLVGLASQDSPAQLLLVASAWALLGTAVGAVAWWARSLLRQLERRPDQAYLSGSWRGTAEFGTCWSRATRTRSTTCPARPAPCCCCHWSPAAR